MNAPHPVPGFFGESLADRDPAIFAAIRKELGRQQDEIELIASENIVSRAVLEAQGSVMTNKYAEGYPGRRYYGGCQFVDIAEELAIDRAKQLFGCGFANVQPNSGSQANQGVFLALLKPGDTILGMSLDAGGHLTHGAAPNISGKWFDAVHYGVRRDTLDIDYDQIAALAEEHRPKMIIAGGSAIPRQIDFARFREIADRVGVIRKGHLVGTERIEDLRNKRLRNVDVFFSDRIPDELKSLQGVTDYEAVSKSRVQLKFKGEMNPLIRLLAKCAVSDFSVSHASLEDMFMEFYGSDRRGAREGTVEEGREEPGSMLDPGEGEGGRS